jgi:hypothetical protein
VHGPRLRKKRNSVECEGRSCARTKCCTATRHQGKGVREQKAGVTGKSYSLEGKYRPREWRAKGMPRRDNKGESGRCSRGVSTIRQRGKKGSMREPYHEGKRRTASAGDPRHGSSMACTTVYTHIGLLTSKGLAQRGEWRRQMEEKEVRNEWSQYGPRTITHSRRDWNISHDLWGVGYSRNFYRGKILFIETTSLIGYPGKSLLMFADNPPNELYFIRPEPVGGI